ncbi:MAG: lactate racemase domain-containing protein [Desulfobacterales bacterium]
MDFPKMIRVRQRFEAPVVEDINQQIVTQVKALGVENKITAGQSVAVACSSRGIANYSTIVKTTVESLKQMRLKPFIVPAMGSHGAATAEGQKKVLENYGISEQKTGVPVRSSLEVVQIDETEDLIPVFMDKLAFEAHHIVPINRVKPHTEFEYDIESGLMKMMAIGLGKKEGARTCHQAIMVYGYPRIILSAARKVLQSGKILFGVGIVENGYSQTATIRVLKPEGLEEGEKGLLKESKRWSARLPFDTVDILIIDEMGKDISGTGFDTKVVGRILMPLVAKEPETPEVKRILVCDLTPKTEGNADGVGIADLVTQRLVDKIDMNALYVNAITGAEPEHAKIPLTLKNDKEGIEIAIGSIGLVPHEQLKIIRIKNTMRLGEVDISEAYREELSRRKDLEIITEARPMAFNQEGNLEPF